MTNLLERNIFGDGIMRLHDEQHPASRGFYHHPDGMVGFRRAYAGARIFCWYEWDCGRKGYKLIGTTKSAQGAEYRKLD